LKQSTLFYGIPKGPYFYWTLALENIPLALGTFHMVRAPFIFHIIPQYGSLGSCGLAALGSCANPRGLCNNNSFINKYDVMIRSSEFFLMSFFNLLTKELWQILECKFWGVNYPNYPFFSDFFSKFSISQNKMPVSISSTRREVGRI